MTRAPRTCSRCGARGHDVRSCTLTPPSADALLAEGDDQRDEDSAAEVAEATEADASAWDPDDVPTAPPAVTVHAPRRSRAQRPTAPAPLTLVMFTSTDHGVTAVAHELLLHDVDVARQIVDAWDTPAILARGQRLVHVPTRAPFGLAWRAWQRIRGAA